MKMKTLAAVIACAAVLVACSEPKQDTETRIESEDQKLSYIFGQNVGGQFKAEGVALDVKAFAAGVEDALSEAEPKLKEDEVMAVLQSFQEKQTAQREAEQNALAEKNKAEGDAYLAENATKDGVITLDSGLQYRIVEEGTGPSPAADDVVEVHYSGRLVDGTEFDSSVKRGVPASFGVNQVIPGWTEALQLMKEGGKWELVIPPSLAYGPGGTGGTIGPNATLIFDVELLKVTPAEESESESEEAGE